MTGHPGDDHAGERPQLDGSIGVSDEPSPGEARASGWKRLFAAVALVPFVAAAAAFLAIALVWRDSVHSDPFEMAGSGAAGVFLVTAPAALIVVLPVAVSWSTRGLLTRNRILLTGLLAGNVFLPVAMLAPGELGVLGVFALGTFVGVGTAFVFWTVGVRSRSSQVSVLQ